MRNCIIICPLGMSPPIATEFLEYVINILRYKVLIMYLIVTDEERVIEGARVVEAAIKYKYPRVKVVTEHLKYVDVDSDPALTYFMRLILRRLREFRDQYGELDILVNIAGGRKTMVLLATLAASLTGVSHIYHIIASDVKAFNEALERVRGDISDIAKIKSLDERVREYVKRIDKLDQIMFPNPDLYRVIRIPIIPYPIDYIGKLMRIITAGRPIKAIDIDLDPTYLNILSMADIIKIYSKANEKYITLGKMGELLKNMLT